MSGSPSRRILPSPLSAIAGGIPNGILRQSQAQSHSHSNQFGGAGNWSNNTATAIAQQQYAVLQQMQQAGLGRYMRYQGFDPGEPEKPPEYQGFVIGEIVGWRCWNVTESGYLKSLTANEIWAPDEPMTTKNGVAGVEGQGKGDVGIHAFNKQRYMLKFAEDWGSEAIAFGRVHLWGDVVEHELGYRAEYARIFAIDELRGAVTKFVEQGENTTTITRHTIEDLRKRYHCDEPPNTRPQS